jgi:hypothetical protein
VLAAAFGNYVGWSPAIGIFLYVAQATHDTHKRQTSMPLVGLEPTISVTALWQFTILELWTKQVICCWSWLKKEGRELPNAEN